MTQTAKKLADLERKIGLLVGRHNGVEVRYQERDISVQAELRLTAGWSIRADVDRIHAPKQLAPDLPYPEDYNAPDRADQIEAWREQDAPWAAMWRAEMEIDAAARLADGYPSTTLAASSKTKTGSARRQQAADAWRLEVRRAFLVAYRAATGKRRLAEVRRQVQEVQARQKVLLVEIRRRNSEHVAQRSEARAEQQRVNVEALASGRFWGADKKALKGHFRPPFDKNALADVSERWRAALFVECESESYKRYNGEWGHKLVGTGAGYLCGIDDNGDEWGHKVHNLPQGYDDHGSIRPEGAVEDAMSILFGVHVGKLGACVRQGDLLFRPVTLATDPAKAPELTPAETWEPRANHVVAGEGLRHNGRYFDAPAGATVTHTSHAVITLPAGAYCVHASTADAD